MGLHHTLFTVTERIKERSAATRRDYLAMIRRYAEEGPGRVGMSCTNLAHACAVADLKTKLKYTGQKPPANIAVVSSYNDMLSAHQPLKDAPELLREGIEQRGATMQFAGGVPAMCDGVTQGYSGMELSLFSRDVIALSTAVALSHNTFDGVLCLGVCDKIVPGLLIGALRFGHLPCIFVPAGPMPSGLTNTEKSEIRRLYAEGKVSKEKLLESEMASYHSPGTCTFYGTANSNQMLMEVMGLHLPGAAFVPPQTELRAELTREAGRRISSITREGEEFLPLGEVLDERSFVNAIVGLAATGGSTNHTIHLVAIARAAGIQITWDDFSALSKVTPLLARVYPNGKADVNEFHRNGGVAFVIRELLSIGLLHRDVKTIMGSSLEAYCRNPELEDGSLCWKEPSRDSDDTILRTADAPFSPEGGIMVLEGNLGRAVVKTSSIPDANRVIEAPAAVFHNQEDFLAAFGRGELQRDFIAVIKFQGPRANGMPELHKLNPALGALQARGFKVALVTDGRMSGASGNVPAAIHATPECLAGGPLAKVQDGDLLTLDTINGVLRINIADDELHRRSTPEIDLSSNECGMGRELFFNFRGSASSSEEGASVISAPLTAPAESEANGAVRSTSEREVSQVSIT